MITVPSQIPYRRDAWRKVVFPARPGAGTVFPEIARWVPSGYIKLAEALQILGNALIEGWSGTEPNARGHNAPPDPPWQWRCLPGHEPTEFFTINDANEKVPASEIEAMGWWKTIEPILLAEGQDELRALKRWLDCREIMRNELASARLIALALAESGEFHPIPRNEWIGKRGGSFLASGVAEFHIPGSYSTVPVRGPVVFDRRAFFPDADPAAPVSASPDLENFPYLAFMVRASKEGPFTQDARVPKKVIETWLRRNWPATLGAPTENKITNMATFLRRPDDEKGGNH